MASTDAPPEHCPRRKPWELQAEVKRNMGILRFSDGMEFNLEGPLRIEERSDGLYVVGEHFMAAVKSREEGERLIAERKQQKPTDE